MRTLVLCSSLLTLAACAATTGTGARNTTPPLVDNQTTPQAIVRPRADIATAERINAPIQNVYDVLPEIYTELGVAEVGADPATRTVGNGRLQVSRRFGGEPLSRYLQCGNTAFGAPLADEARVEMDLRTTVSVDAAGGTSLRTVLTAMARNNRGTSADHVACNSTGVLERRITTMVRQKTGSAN
jgi:hypothetical protein